MISINFPFTTINVMIVKKTSLLFCCSLFWLASFGQNVGIGTTSPSASLHVNGTFKLSDGTHGDGKVLVSDNSGKASWQAMTGMATGDENVSGMGNWNECASQNITAFQPIFGNQGDCFMGRQVAMTDEYAFVGMSAYDTLTRTNTGIVVVYQLQGNAWVEVQRLADATGTTEAYFGWSLAADGNVLVIGAPSENIAGNNRAGSISIYHYGGGIWYFKKKITLSVPAPNDNFGWSVDIDGNNLVVGAPRYGGTGRAFVYTNSGGDWQYFTQIPNASGSANDAFAEDVAITDNLLAIGAPGYDVDSLDCGSVFVYQLTTSDYVFTDHLFPNQYGFRRNSNASFGRSLDIDGDNLVVGVPAFRPESEYIGGIALYKFNGSHMEYKFSLRSDTNKAGDNFGLNVSLSGAYCLAGASGTVQAGVTNLGSYRLYKLLNNTLIKISDIVDPTGDSISSHLFSAINANTKRFVLGNPYKNNLSGAVTFGKVKI